MWLSFEQKVHIVLQSAAIAFLMVLVWFNCFYLTGIHFSHEDEIAVTAVGIAGPFIVFGIWAPKLLDITYGRSEKLLNYWADKNKRMFVIYRDERPPIDYFVLVFVSPPCIIFQTMCLDYHSVWSGVVVVSISTFVFMAYLIAIFKLQDPTKSPWFSKRISQDWLTASVDDVFDT